MNLICKINYVNMQQNYVSMRVFHVKMKHVYVGIQHNYVNVRPCMIDWIRFFDVSAIFQPCNEGPIKIIMLTCDFIILYFTIIMLHVDMNKSYVYIKYVACWHNLACMGQRYATKYNSFSYLESALTLL